MLKLMPDWLAIKANDFIDNVPVTSIWIHAFRNHEPNVLPMH
jgi:hypothetical protein